ncbi:MAG TPA: hypothetical protein PK513_01045 [Alphaproteobacteria bacterium]|nr:hypothetical protein [Alphaproteobacteria bacterium]USO04763.1 MAG: hypothetical protein H6859_06230 [Rhodospirillales bacterium]HOO81074.1 hypothetical protein [Alphaproteobacteria bacterium]
MENYTKRIKTRIAQFLNSATAVVVQSYERYLSSDLPKNLDDESKGPAEFKKFHDAGKSAASHLESLLKLADATDDSEQQEKIASRREEQENIQARIQSARAELEEGDE